MKQLVFSTGNDMKFLTAKHACTQYGVNLTQRSVDIIEIQEDPKQVALDKAQKAFAAVSQPLVITDDSWSFAGLKGFPGVYMHSINEWFSPEDFLRLTSSLTDRTVTLTVYLIYVDGKQQKVFTRQTKGHLLKEIRGTSKYASHTIITMDGDNGLSIAQAHEQANDKSARSSARIWHEFAEWFGES
ncbi:MAG: non-canonical purine NTP pyrophosphatase [Candidatus Saccharimonadales bacterium]